MDQESHEIVCRVQSCTVLVNSITRLLRANFLGYLISKDLNFTSEKSKAKSKVVHLLFNHIQ